jgi:hypothetical protein
VAFCDEKLKPSGESLGIASNLYGSDPDAEELSTSACDPALDKGKWKKSGFVGEVFSGSIDVGSSGMTYVDAAYTVMETHQNMICDFSFDGIVGFGLGRSANAFDGDLTVDEVLETCDIGAETWMTLKLPPFTALPAGMKEVQMPPPTRQAVTKLEQPIFALDVDFNVPESSDDMLTPNSGMLWFGEAAAANKPKGSPVQRFQMMAADKWEAYVYGMYLKANQDLYNNSFISEEDITNAEREYTDLEMAALFDSGNGKIQLPKPVCDAMWPLVGALDKATQGLFSQVMNGKPVQKKEDFDVGHLVLVLSKTGASPTSRDDLVEVKISLLYLVQLAHSGIASWQCTPYSPKFGLPFFAKYYAVFDMGDNSMELVEK